MPAREREQETGAQKYKGASIPSKTFRYLQILTQEEEQNQIGKTANETVVISSGNNQNANFERVRRSSRSQISEIQTQPVSQKYETRSEAFIKKFEPNSESTEQRIETRSEALTQSYREPRSESVVKKFESSSKSIVATSNFSESIINNNIMTGMF